MIKPDFKHHFSTKVIIKDNTESKYMHLTYWSREVQYKTCKNSCKHTFI